MNRLIWVAAIAGTTLLCLAGCGRESGPTNFSLSGPNQVSKPGLPFMSYTIATRAGGNPEFVYFLIVKPPAPRKGGGQQSSNSSEGSAVGRKGRAKSKFMFNGKEVTTDYKMTAHADGTLETESFEIGGKKQTFEKGRVFLVDLSAEPVTITPHDVAFPTTIPDLSKPRAAEGLAETTLKELEKDPDIARFTRPLR
jgi:hypothetical protein